MRRPKLPPPISQKRYLDIDVADARTDGFICSLRMPWNPLFTGLCFAALLVENEIQDLFGIAVTGLVLDYHQHLLLTKEAPVKPFCRVPGVSVSTVETAKGGDK